MRVTLSYYKKEHLDNLCVESSIGGAAIMFFLQLYDSQMSVSIECNYTKINVQNSYNRNHHSFIRLF